MSKEVLLGCANLQIGDEAFREMVRKGLGDALRDYRVDLQVETVFWLEDKRLWHIELMQVPREKDATE